MGSEIASIPKLDFSRLEAEGTAAWASLHEQVMCALQSHGCFEVVYERVTPELRDALFDRAMPEFFGLPLDTEMLAKADFNKDGYSWRAWQKPRSAYRSILIEEEEVEKFTNVMWPHGNDTFRDTVSSYLKHLKDLEKIIVRMVFLHLGIEKYCNSFYESRSYHMLLAEYAILMEEENRIAMQPHLDYNLVTILRQHKVEGLEIKTKDGEWIRMSSSPNTYIVFIGEAFQAWTNGRLQSPYHRVRIMDNGKRNSVGVGSIFKDGYIIQSPKELVNEEHPLVYKPYTIKDYVSFRFSGQEGRDKSTLYDFCGIKEDELKPKV